MSKVKIDSNSIMSPSSVAASILREEIKNGSYSVGERLSNERLLSERFSLSRVTVRKVLDILANERLIIRQHGRGTFVADPAFASSGQNGMPIIGSLVYMKEVYFNKIIDKACTYAANRGYLMTSGLNSDQESEITHVEAFIRSGITGVVIAPIANHSLVAYERLLDAKIPVVMLDSILPGIVEDFVSVDNRAGTYMATKYLIQIGHENIGFVGHDSDMDIPCKPERILGVKTACDYFQKTFNNKFLIKTNDNEYPAVLEKMLKSKDRPTAFIAYNDIWASRIISIAKKVGLQVPEDISVIGFDNSMLSKNFEVSITTIAPDFEAIGKTAIDLLLEKIEKPKGWSSKTILITPTLLKRKSTAATQKTNP